MSKEIKKTHYAHSIQIYGRFQEKKELKYLAKKFSNLVDPNNDMGELGTMTPYLKMVRTCKIVVFSEYEGYIGPSVEYLGRICIGCDFLFSAMHSGQ